MSGGPTRAAFSLGISSRSWRQLTMNWRTPCARPCPARSYMGKAAEVGLLVD